MAAGGLYAELYGIQRRRTAECVSGLRRAPEPL